ncbi:MAG TPA: DUF1207 domain-containing protein [Methylomirabilota bacterium]|nr:DUF1207 domain-containing protein [Methylomirabilota bacterium]
MRGLGLGLAALLLALGAVGPAAAAGPSDGWLEGYAAAVLERELHVTAPSLRVREGVITLRAEDLGGADVERVRQALGAIRGALRVEIVGAAAPPAAAPPAPLVPVVITDYQTGLLPGGTLFKPLVADPRWPHFSAAYQNYLRDPSLRDVAAVSFGETFSLLRERYWRTWWEVGIQAGVFAIFDLDAQSKDLINADYFVAIPFSFRRDALSGLFRVFHQSSHLGDEFLLRTRPHRINLSYEGLDAKLSYELFGDTLRAYGGAGYLFERDPANIQPWSLQYGAEFASPWPPRDAGWRPIAAVDFQHREENDWSTDFSARAGVQIDGVLASRNMQLLIEYFLGRSPNGQFFKEKIEYIGLGAHFHF